MQNKRCQTQAKRARKNMQFSLQNCVQDGSTHIWRDMIFKLAIICNSPEKKEVVR